MAVYSFHRWLDYKGYRKLSKVASLPSPPPPKIVRSRFSLVNRELKERRFGATDAKRKFKFLHLARFHARPMSYKALILAFTTWLFYLKLRCYVKYGLILLRAKYKKNSSSGFYFPSNLRILGALFDKKQNNALHQLIFTPMFLKVKRSDFSETFTWGNYMLEDYLRPECH